MTSSNGSPTRRQVLRTLGGVGVGLVATGTTTAQSGETRPDWGGYLDGVDGGYRDARDEEEVTVTVGATGNEGDFAFAPAGLWISPGTTVKWEWNGMGGQHNVVGESNDLDSGSPVSTTGVEYEFTFEESGIYKYYCTPHQPLGMQAAVAVGDDVPTVSQTDESDSESDSGGSDGEAERGGGGSPTISLRGGTFSLALFGLTFGATAVLVSGILVSEGLDEYRAASGGKTQIRRGTLAGFVVGILVAAVLGFALLFV